MPTHPNCPQQKNKIKTRPQSTRYTFRTNAATTSILPRNPCPICVLKLSLTPSFPGKHIDSIQAFDCFVVFSSLTLSFVSHATESLAQPHITNEVLPTGPILRTVGSIGVDTTDSGKRVLSFGLDYFVETQNQRTHIRNCDQSLRQQQQ